MEPWVECVDYANMITQIQLQDQLQDQLQYQIQDQMVG